MIGPLDLIAAPVLGPIHLIQWLGQKLTAENEMYDEGRLRGELLELQVRYDMGEVTEDEYNEREESLLRVLGAIREAKA